MHTILLLTFYTGAFCLAYEDARTQTVHALLSDGWLLVVLLLTASTATNHLLPAAVTFILLAGFSILTHGLGSADVIVLISITAVFGPIACLLALLCSSLSCLLWALFRNCKRVAFIPHLLLGTLLMTVLRLLPAVNALFT